MATVAFIGLGNMGGPMAVNLIKAGHTVTVFDLSQEACDQLQEAGAAVFIVDGEDSLRTFEEWLDAVRIRNGGGELRLG